MTQKNKILVICGPTAVGKTALSIELAERFNGEIISGDSMQVYRGLDLGTAKVTAQEARGIPHHLIDCREISEAYSVADFQKMGRAAIQDIQDRGKLPIVVGGTGFYIEALLYDLKLGGTTATSNEQSQEIRGKWQQFYELKGAEGLHQELKRQDAAAASRIHPNNVRRVIRALEVFETTGKSIFQQQAEAPVALLYPHYLLGLTTDRSLLYERINQRVDVMLEQGLLEEAAFVKDHAEYQSAQGIGYKEFGPYFSGQCSLEASVAAVKQNSRRYAKRQLTWFRNKMTAHWWDLVTTPADLTELIQEVAAELSAKEET